MIDNGPAHTAMTIVFGLVCLTSVGALYLMTKEERKRHSELASRAR